MGESQKILWADLETTGRNHFIHGPTEIAAVADVDGEKVGEFEAMVCPWPGAVIEDEALEVTNKTRSELLSYEPEEFVFRRFVSFLKDFIEPFDTDDKFWLGAFNQTFDVDFLSRFWERHKEEKQFFGSFINRRPNLDPRVLASTLVFKGEMDEPENFKLTTLCEHIGLETNEQEAHSALYDAELCRTLFYKLNKRL